MDFQHEKSFECLQTVLNSRLTIRDSWNKIIDFHEQIISKPYWNSLRQLDLDGEQIEIKNWLEQLVTITPLPDNVIAIWIGLLKFGDNDEEIPAIHLVGADTYNNDDIEWACDPTYLSPNRYAELPLLKQIDDIIRTDEENYQYFDWILPLAYTALTLDEIVRTKLNKKLFLKSKDKLFVATGHDSGDYLDISCIA